MKTLFMSFSIFLILLFFSQLGNTQILPRKIDKITYLGNYPKDKKGNWTDNLQGISNNKDYWFFTQLTKIWKVPIGFDLRKSKTLKSGKKGVKMVKMPRVLSQKGYNHFGDPDNFDGFIFIPIEGGKIELTPPFNQLKKSDITPVIGVFRETDLKFLGYQELPNKTRSGWCAIHPITRNLYTSHNNITSSQPIDVYQIDWSALKRKSKFKLKWKGKFPLYKLPSSWKGKVATYMQGGDFSDDGRYLFLLNGKASGSNTNKGISVYEVVKQSQGSFLFTSKQKSGFRYQFSPGASKWEEPEGLTFVNLKKNKRTKFPGGQLHAIVLNHEVRTDGIYLKHYKINYK